MKVKKRVWELRKIEDIFSKNVCLICSGLDGIMLSRSKLESLGLSVMVLSSSVLRQLLGLKLGGNVVVVFGSGRLMLENRSKIEKLGGFTCLYWVIDGVCLGYKEKVMLDGRLGVGKLVGSQLFRSLGSLVNIHKKIIWLIRENGNNQSVK